MKNLICLLLAAIFFSFCGCSNRSKKTSTDYSSFQWGEYLYYYNKTDSAFLMFSRTVLSSTDSIEKGKAYRYLAVIQRGIGDQYGAQENLTAALRTLDVNNKNHHELLSSVYNILGNTSLDLKRYNEAITFYDKALLFANEKNNVLEILNGKATTFQKKGNYSQAIAIYDSILAMQPSDVPLVARAISNRARTRWLKDPNYPALPEYWLALKIRIDSQINRGLNASYAHLSDYYSVIRTDSALYYAKKMYEKAEENKSPDDILEAVDKLVRLNSTPALKEQWYEKFKKLNDSIQMAKDTTKSQFALIKYDVQKSKADNLILQQHITRQRAFMYGLSALAILILIGISSWYNRRRERLKLESENAIRESKLKTSRKVHDVVANGLYRIMNELEHRSTIDKEPLLNKIEGLYEQSRDISYEQLPTARQEFDQQVHHLLTSFANDHTKIIVIGNQQTFWNRITSFQKNELQLVLSEIMINMQKHSRSKNVVIHFKQENGICFINYKDDGIGFPPGIQFGNGLNNTVNRIKSLKGAVNFENSGGEGVLIVISFPLQSLST